MENEKKLNKSIPVATAVIIIIAVIVVAMLIHLQQKPLILYPSAETIFQLSRGFFRGFILGSLLCIIYFLYLQLPTPSPAYERLGKVLSAIFVISKAIDWVVAHIFGYELKYKKMVLIFERYLKKKIYTFYKR